MEPYELLGEIRAELEVVEKKGQSTVPIDGLRRLLHLLEQDAGDTAEARRRAHEGTLAYAAAVNQSNLELFKSVIDSGKSAIDALLLINGGAVVTLLGVLSNLAGKDNGDRLAQNLASPLLLFGIGVLAAAVTFGVRYFAQDCYAKTDDRFDRIGDTLKWVSIVVGAAGYVLFGCGIVQAYKAVTLAFGS